MVNLYDNSWAVLIGVGNFENTSITILPNPVNDINNIAKILETYCDYPSGNITKLTNNGATRENILQIFDSELSTKVGTNDRLLVYFSGHGITRQNFGRQGNDVGYLVPYDAKGSIKKPRYTSLLAFNELLDVIHKSTKARQLLFILDCCFSGIITKGLEGQSEFERGLCANDMVTAGRDLKSVQMLTAGGPNEQILDSGSNPNVSILNDSIQKFIEKVNPADYTAGFISARNLAKEVNLMVGRRSILLKKSQTPRFSQSIYDEAGEFVFKKFSDEEILNANKPKINYNEIEVLVKESRLRTIFSRDNLLGFLETVEQSHGKNYSLSQLRDTVFSITNNHEDIKKEVVALVASKNLDSAKKEKLTNYIAENVISIGLARSIFNPRFIEFDETEGDIKRSIQK